MLSFYLRNRPSRLPSARYQFSKFWKSVRPTNRCLIKHEKRVFTIRTTDEQVGTSLQNATPVKMSPLGRDETSAS